MSLGCGKGQEDCRFSFCCSGFFRQHGFGFISEWVCFVAVRRISVCLTVMFPVILFLSSCKQPLKAWCTLRNNFKQKILTRHWKLTVCPLSPSFRAKWGVTPNGLITQDVWKSTSRHWCAVSDWKCYIAIPRYCEHSCLWFLQMLCLKYSC